MSYETLSFLFQLISAISVIVSFVYLAYQIRQNTRATRRAATRDIIRDLNEVGRMFIEFPDLTKLYLTVVERPQELTDEERLRFQRLIAYMFSSFQLALEYHSDGLLSDDSIETYAQAILQLFESSVVTEWWETEGQFYYGQGFRDLVSERRAA